MKLLVTESFTDLLERELTQAGRREIGGVLLGERVSAGVFRITDASVQRSGGSATHFVRELEPHRTFVEAFLDRTGRDYSRFNYIGEWHSHPTVAPLPSFADIVSMQSIVEDEAVNAGFALLVIARRHFLGRLELSASVFRQGDEARFVNLAPCPSDSTPAAFRSAPLRKRFWI